MIGTVTVAPGRRAPPVCVQVTVPDETLQLKLAVLPAETVATGGTMVVPATAAGTVSVMRMPVATSTAGAAVALVTTSV